MPTTTTGSSNIATLDSRILADLCAGNFSVDITPSIYIGSGENNVLGASVRIVNPFGVTIKDYPTSGYDIYPPMSDAVTVAVPTQAGNYQYGKYTVTVLLTDASGTQYSIEKVVSICAPNLKDKTKKFGSLSATLNGICKDGKLYVTADSVPTYNGALPVSQVNDFTLQYPTSSGLAPLPTTLGAFSTLLFEGVYKFTGTACATYSFGDSVTASVTYKYKREKNVRCLLDETCIAARLTELDAQTKSDCTDAEKQATQGIIINTLRLVKTIELLTSAGLDAGDYIDELEALLGCVCTCNCADGTPVINTTPARDVVIEGCNVEKTTVGLTDSYTIDNYAYTVTVTENGGVLIVSAPVLSDCTKTQNFTFSIATLYTQIKALVTADTTPFWANIVGGDLTDLSTVCIGSPAAWASWTFKERMQYILNRFCTGTCFATISDNATNATGSFVDVGWTNVDSVYAVDIYLDGLLNGTVLAPLEAYVFHPVDFVFGITGVADGAEHTYRLVARCSNGAIGNSLEGTFNYMGCPTIATPTVTTTLITAACPFNLEDLIDTIPLGTTAVWHTANNTLFSTYYATPATATEGVYYLFALDNVGFCYSLGKQVTLLCSSTTSCTAPQNLIVESIMGGYRVRFASAAFPPPSNSYTVKRRLFIDADVDGSYTTIGTPTYNISAARWEILDVTAIDDTLYVYRAISNCASSAPFIDYTYANILCPDVTLTPAENSMDYSFTDSGSGNIDKYEVSIYDSSGITLIHTDTINPAFSTPVTGTFIYLDAGTTYKVKLKIFIGTYFKVCTATSAATTGGTEITAFLSRSGSAGSGTLTLNISGGTPPYAYNFACSPVGACNSYTIDSPSGTTPDIATSTYSVVLYAGVTYQFLADGTDFDGNLFFSNVITNPACLVPDTLISLKGGMLVELGQIEVGDTLFGEGNKVEAIEKRVVDKLYVINDGLLKASEGHVHILSNGNLVQSTELKEGDFLAGRNGTGITKITRIEIQGGTFDVIDMATTTGEYIANGILTHNKLACP